MKVKLELPSPLQHPHPVAKGKNCNFPPEHLIPCRICTLCKAHQGNPDSWTPDTEYTSAH